MVAATVPWRKGKAVMTEHRSSTKTTGVDTIRTLEILLTAKQAEQSLLRVLGMATRSGTPAMIRELKEAWRAADVAQKTILTEIRRSSGNIIPFRKKVL